MVNFKYIKRVIYFSAAQISDFEVVKYDPGMGTQKVRQKYHDFRFLFYTKIKDVSLMEHH